MPPVELPAAEGPWRSRAPGDPGQAWPVAILVALESPGAGMQPGMYLELLMGPVPWYPEQCCAHVFVEQC